MANFQDKDLVNAMLSEHKLSITNLATLVMESANQNLRNDVTTILNSNFKHQKQIFDLMSQKGWYVVENATKQDIQKAYTTLTGNQNPTTNMQY